MSRFRARSRLRQRGRSREGKQGCDSGEDPALTDTQPCVCPYLLPDNGNSLRPPVPVRVLARTRSLARLTRNGLCFRSLY